MATRRFDEGEDPRRWSGRESEAWPRSGEVGEHDRPWHQPEETWSSRRGMYGVGGAERAYNLGGYAPGEYERGYEMRSYDRLLDASERRYGQGRWQGDSGLSRWGRGLRERDMRSGWGGPLNYPDERVRSSVHRGWDRYGGYHAEGGVEWVARGRGPKGYQRSDERIREDICERLMDSPYDASDVEVRVSQGEVTLEGSVRSRDEKRGIEDVAHAVRGIHDVHNRIRVSATQQDRLVDGDFLDTLHS